MHLHMPRCCACSTHALPALPACVTQRIRDGKGNLVHSKKWARPCASSRNSAAVAQAVVVMQANVLVASINEANKALSDHAREA